MNTSEEWDGSLFLSVFYGTFTGKVFSLSEELQIVVVCLEVKLFEIFIIINQMSQFASIPVTFSHWIFINS